MNSMKKTLFAFAVLLVLAFNCAGQGSCPRYREPQGGFSICLPWGWVAEARDGEKFKTLFAPQANNGIRPNIGFDVGMIKVSFEADLADIEKKVLSNQDNQDKLSRAGFTTVKFLSKSDFVTDSKMRGIKLIFSGEFKGFQLRILQYYFDAEGRRILFVTCTFLEKDQRFLGPIMDNTLKTFQLDK